MPTPAGKLATFLWKLAKPRHSPGGAEAVCMMLIIILKILWYLFKMPTPAGNLAIFWKENSQHPPHII